MKRSIKDTPVMFLGAGNLATNLAKALYRKGFRIMQVYNRTEESTCVLTSEVGAEYVTDLKDISNEARLYTISLKDAAFVELLPQITDGKWRVLLVHTASSISMNIWEGHAKRYGVFYSMQTFSKQREVDFRKIPLLIEARRPEDVELLRTAAGTLSDKVYGADLGQRRSPHLAAVLTCNFTNHVYAPAAELLEKYHLPSDVMSPLTGETVREVRELAPRDTQTGSTVYYDGNVTNKRLPMLADSQVLQEIYKLIGKNIHEHRQL